MMRELGSARRRPFAPAQSSTEAIEAACRGEACSPGTLMYCIVS